MKYFFLSLSFLSIIPVPQKFLKDNNFHKIVSFFPLTGGFLGLVSYIFLYFFSFFLPKDISFLLAIFFYHILNGGLHLDGFADFFDAIFGAKKDKSRFKEILKDSRIGTMGTFALFLYFSLIIKITDLINPTMRLFIFLGMAGRVTIANTITFSRSLFEDGLGNFFIEKCGIKEFLNANISFLIVSFILGLKFFFLALIVIIFSLIFKYLIIKTFGGFSGDLFGAGCIITEMLVLLYLIK